MRPEALLVVGLAAQARDREEIGRRRARRKQPRMRQGAAAHTSRCRRHSASMTTRETLTRPPTSCAAATRRSAAASNSRNTVGMFHRSLICRIVTPAAEYGISCGQPGRVPRLHVAAAGAGRERFQQAAILLGVEALRDAIEALERRDVGADLLLAPTRGQLGNIQPRRRRVQSA